MLDIFSRIDSINQKYGINTNRYMKELLERMIEEIVEKAADKYGRQVVVRGVKAMDSDNYTFPFLNLVEKHMDIIAVQDQIFTKPQSICLNGKTIPAFPIGEEIPACDIYLIRAMRNGQVIAYENRDLKNRGIKILDIYNDIMNENGILPRKPYELYDKEQDYSIYRIKEAYRIFENVRNEEAFLSLLGQCLFLGDFVSLSKYREENRCMVAKWNRAKSFLLDVDILIQDIREAIQERNKKFSKKDILWHWMDTISYEELELIPLTHKRIKSGIVFTEAYTPTPYTKPATKAIFFQEFHTSDSLETKYLEETTIYEAITSLNYDFCIFGHINTILRSNNPKLQPLDNHTASSFLYLKMLQAMISADKPGFYLVHTLIETHTPFSSPWENFPMERNVFWHTYKELYPKISASASYADHVTEFYSELLGEGTIGLYMSDHGKYQFHTERRYKDRPMHIFIGITNLNIKAEISRLFPIKDFEKLIQFILYMNDNRVEMLMGDRGIYSEKLRINIQTKGGDVQDLLAGYTGVKTLTDKYVLMDNGTEYYFLKEEGETKNYINNMEHKERIDYLRDSMERKLRDLEQ